MQTAANAALEQLAGIAWQDVRSTLLQDLKDMPVNLSDVDVRALCMRTTSPPYLCGTHSKTHGQRCTRPSTATLARCSTLAALMSCPAWLRTATQPCCSYPLRDPGHPTPAAGSASAFPMFACTYDVVCTNNSIVLCCNNT